MFEEPNFCRLIQWDIEGGRHPTEEDNLVAAAGGCLRPGRDPQIIPDQIFPLTCSPILHLRQTLHGAICHGATVKARLIASVLVSEGHGGHPPWLMNSEYLGDLVGRALWAKYRDNGWSQPGDRGTNMDLGSGEQAKQANRFPGLVFSLVILSSMLLLLKLVLSYRVSLDRLRYAALQLESLKGFQA